MGRPSFPAGSAGLCPRPSSANFYFLAVVEEITGTGNEGVGCADAAQDLDLRAEVAAESDGDEVERVVLGDGDHMHAAVIDDQRAGGDDEGGVLLGKCELDLRVHAGQER